MKGKKSEKHRWPTALASLQLRKFRWLFAGNITFFFVVQGQIVTRSFLAWDLTHQETALAMISLAVAVPMLLASLVSGAVADRLDRRRVILIGQVVLLGNEIFVLGLLSVGALQYWHLLCVSFVSGCAFPFIMPARMVIIFDIVGSQYFGNAMALANGVVNLSRVAGPAMMGIVLDIFDARAAYVIAVVLYIVSIFCMLFIKVEQPPRHSDKPLFTDMVEGFRYVLSHKAVLVCIAFGLLPMMLAMPVQNLFIVFANEVWQVGERGFGIMIAASGVGGVLGSLWVAGRGERTNRLNVMVGSTTVFGLFLLLFSQSPNFSLAITALVLANIFASASQTLNHTVSLLLADSRMKGRVSGLMGISFGLTPLGVLPIAFASEKWGVEMAVGGACIVLVLMVLVFYLLNSTLRNLDTHVLARSREGRIEPVGLESN